MAVHPLFRIAEAAERTAAASERNTVLLEEILRLMKEGCPPPDTGGLVQLAPFEGYTLTCEGVVLNGNGPVGQIDLNRIGVGRNVPSQIFAAITGSKLLGTASVAELDVFFRSSRVHTAQHFGKACRRLLADWHAQLEELLG
jgi:hypothetical protein